MVKKIGKQPIHTDRGQTGQQQQLQQPSEDDFPLEVCRGAGGGVVHDWFSARVGGVEGKGSHASLRRTVFPSLSPADGEDRGESDANPERRVVKGSTLSPEGRGAGV
ncbi:hypothetical protein niasHT_016490 [Heterodera trifolii]|uniref:Uncharacterized protein n=1 Tax=Heterodera trifolii TaxID=157864 RepID=A0ABD2KXH8_9BILA